MALFGGWRGQTLGDTPLGIAVLTVVSPFRIWIKIRSSGVVIGEAM
jgi:hypothetical protein